MFTIERSRLISGISHGIVVRQPPLSYVSTSNVPRKPIMDHIVNECAKYREPPQGLPVCRIGDHTDYFVKLSSGKQQELPYSKASI